MIGRQVRRVGVWASVGALLGIWVDSGGLPHFKDDYRRVCALLNNPTNNYREECLDTLIALYSTLPDHQKLVLAQRLDCGSHVMMSRAGCTVSDYLPECHLNKVIASTHELSNRMKDILVKLVETTHDPCAIFYADEAFHMSHRHWSPEEELLWVEGQNSADASVTPPRPDRKKLIVILEALLAHSLESGQCHRMHSFGICNILRDVWQYFQYQSETSILVRTATLQILSNLVLAGKAEARAGVQGGWMRLVRDLVDSPPQQLEMSLLSSKLLANLQSSLLNEPVVYPYGIHILHQPPSKATPQFDIVFVHGLRGGIFRSWRQKDIPPARFGLPKLSNFWPTAIVAPGEPRTRCWPKDWLPNDLRMPVRILGVDYSSSVSDWTAPCPHDLCRHQISTRANTLRLRLKEAGVGTRPIVWITHSMGGLIVKHILCQSKDGDGELLAQTIGCIFMAVPHKGTPVASKTLTSRSRHLMLPSVEIGLLLENHPDLLKLDKDFKDLVANHKFRVLNVGETMKTSIKLARVPLGSYFLVPEISAKTDYGDYVTIHESHHNISKPDNKKAPIYNIVVQFLNSFI